MHIERNFSKPANGFRHMRLSGRFKALIEAKAASYTPRDATLDELLEFERESRLHIAGLAATDVLLRLHDWNPSIFQVVEQAASGRAAGFSAQLPLSAAGVEALQQGRFSAGDPDTTHLVRDGESAEGIYVWLTLSPRALVATVAGLARYLARYAPRGCKLFTTPANEGLGQLLVDSGFEPARRHYPKAPEALIMAFPEHETGGPGQGKIDVNVARTLDDLAKVMTVRAATYMYEQECPYDEEFDGNDLTGTHLLGTIGGEPAGCIRIRYFADFVKFERLAVRREFRASKLSFRLVREAMRFVAQKGYARVYGHARFDLVRFWETFGFRAMPGRPAFAFSDVEYVEMEGPIRLNERKVALGDDPLRMIRPEGAWDEPGVLERRGDPARQGRIGELLARRVEPLHA